MRSPLSLRDLFMLHHHKEEGSCLALDCIGMFVMNELGEHEREQVEKHCALCEPCQEQLVEIFRALILPAGLDEQINR